MHPARVSSSFGSLPASEAFDMVDPALVDTALLTYVLASPYTRIAALLAGFAMGIICAAAIARVNQR